MNIFINLVDTCSVCLGNCSLVTYGKQGKVLNNVCWNCFGSGVEVLSNTAEDHEYLKVNK